MDKLLRLGKYDFQCDKERGEREVKGKCEYPKGRKVLVSPGQQIRHVYMWLT